ncbi:MAG: hypothetical protein OCD01_01890 [Fibrobacterales bacterium]
MKQLLYKNVKLILLVILVIGSAFGSGEDIILVVSKESTVDSVSESEIKKLYFGKQALLNTQFTTPTILKIKSTHKKFLDTFLKINTRQFARIWQKLVFTGKAQMPKQYTSESGLIEMLQENPNKVGYIQRKNITETIKELEVTP